jgi:hypothetical protein
MRSSHDVFAQCLEAEWSKPAGFLGKLRDGVFDPPHGAEFVSLLRSFRFPEASIVDRRLVSLLWYIPSFLHWQAPQVEELGGDRSEFEQLRNQVQEQLEEILGVP